MNMKSERGGAVLITTILILMISAVIAMSLLNTSRVGSRVSANYKLQENAFNLAEAGFERVRSQFVNFNNMTARLFYNATDINALYDPNFNLYDEITGTTGAYAIYYSLNPQFKGTEAITMPDGKTLIGEWYIRIIDNDLTCNKPLAGDYLSGGYLNTDKIKAALAIVDPGDKKVAMNGVMLSCRELDNTGAGGTGELCNSMPTIDFSKNWDRSVFVESRAIIRQNGQIIASRMARFLVRTEAAGGGGRNPTQKGGAAGGTRGTISAGVTPIGWGQ